MKKRVIFNQQEIEDSVLRIAREIIDRHQSMDDVVLVGIRTCGAFLAKRLQEAIAQMNVPKPPTGVLDITLYRDDFSMGLPQPVVGKTEIPFSLKDKKVILVDDVLYTGRTARAAMDALIDFGRPKFIRLAVLVDRGLRELPIQADFVGKRIVTSPREEIVVLFREAGGDDRVILQEKLG